MDYEGEAVKGFIMVRNRNLKFLGFNRWYLEKWRALKMLAIFY